MCSVGLGDVEMCYTVTRRGAPSLLLDGNGFVARKKRGARVYWSCRSRWQGCPARALTMDGRLIARTTNHNHSKHSPVLDEHKRIESLIETIPVNK